MLPGLDNGYMSQSLKRMRRQLYKLHAPVCIILLSQVTCELQLNEMNKYAEKSETNTCIPYTSVANPEALEHPIPPPFLNILLK